MPMHLGLYAVDAVTRLADPLAGNTDPGQDWKGVDEGGDSTSGAFIAHLCDTVRSGWLVPEAFADGARPA